MARFWQTIKDDLFEYLIYYNEIRNHQSLDGQTPFAFLNSCQRFT
ncbi:IS3 family transposase [Rickettsia endosymbiont of Urophora cardui]